MSDKRKLADLIPDHANANKGTERGRYALEASLRQYGAGRSILLDKNGRIIAGNKTAEVAADIGLEDVVIVQTDGKQIVAVQRTDLDIDSAEGRGLAYADNRVGELSLDWDAEQVLADINAGVDLSALFRQDELDEMLADLQPKGTEGDTEPQIDRAEELRQKWGVEPGDLWQLGEHRLICGDCTDAAVVARLLQGEKPALMVTDPPYGVDYDGVVNDAPDLLVPLLDGAFAIADSVLEIGSVYYICFPDVHSYEFAGAIRRMGWKQGRPPVVLWLKDVPVMGRGDYNSQFEQMFYGWKGQGHYFAGEIYTNVWAFERPKVAAGHPTVKPVGLFENAVKNSSKAGMIVYEPFSGSGTTLIACENLGRRCRAVEIAPGYVAVALERWATHTGNTPIKLG